MSFDKVVDNIRQNLDIVQVIGEVVPLKKSGTNFFGVCPFHSEKTPSFSVSATKQLFHCFGCKVGGDVFKFVQLYYRWDFPQSLEELAKRAGVTLEKSKSDPFWDEGFQVLDFASKFFEDSLHTKSGDVFRNYLKERKIPEKLWKDFRIGAHLGGSHLLVEELEKRAMSLDTGVRLGLLGRTERGDYIDRFQGRLIFPILDERARTRGFGGRTLGNDHPKYINSPKTPHFDKGRLFYGMHLACTQVSRKGYAVLVEGYLDVIALHEYGIANALGSMGTALTLDQIRLLKRWSPRVISLYDADRAGLAATERNLGNFLREGLESKVVVLQGAKDPDSLLHDESKTPDERKKILVTAFDESILAIDYLVQNTVLVEKNAQQRGKKLRSLVDILDHVPDEIERTVLKKDLAKRFELPEAMLFATAETRAVNQLPTTAPMGASSRPATTTPSNDRWEREILKFLILNGDLGDFSLTEAMPFLGSASKWGNLLLRLAELELKSGAIAQLKWLEEIEPELQSAIREWVLEVKQESVSQVSQMLWSDLIRGLKRSYVQRESERIQKDLVAAETEKNFDRVRSLLSEKQSLVRMIQLQ